MKTLEEIIREAIEDPFGHLFSNEVVERLVKEVKAYANERVEEAAKITEQWINQPTPRDSYDWRGVLKLLAQEIRALKDP